MTPFFLAVTAFLRATLPELPQLAGSRTSPARVLSLITVGCLCFLPGPRATARSDEPRPINAAATLLNSFGKCPVLAFGLPSKRMVYSLRIPTTPFRSLFP
jgi:hypothetical protein